MLCPIHDRFYLESRGGCPACEGKTVPTDDSLLSQWDGATGSDIHERNRIRSNYSYACWLGDKDVIEKWEKYMRGVIAKKQLEKLKHAENAI